MTSPSFIESTLLSQVTGGRGGSQMACSRFRGVFLPQSGSAYAFCRKHGVSATYDRMDGES